MAINEILRNGVVLLPKDFYGLSTDTKPTTDSSGMPLSPGSSFTATDTGDVSFYDGSAWWQIARTVRIAENVVAPIHLVVNQTVPANGYWAATTFTNLTGYSHLGVGAYSDSTSTSWTLGSILSPDGINACGTAGRRVSSWYVQRHDKRPRTFHALFQAGYFKLGPFKFTRL